MNNRPLAIGCGIFLVLVAGVVGAGIYFIPKWVDQGITAVKDGFKEESEASLFAANWEPPSPKPDGSWFPQQIGKWKLITREASKGIPQLNVDRPGEYAAYRSGAGVTEVRIIPANGLEKKALLAMVGESRVGESSRMTSFGGDRAYLRLGDDDYTRLWWIKNWLFVFHQTGADPQDFVKPYLSAIQAFAPSPKPSETPEPQRK